MREFIFKAPEVVINYVSGPNNGPALLLLHGNFSRYQYFQNLMPNLIPISHLYALDLRGHGRSGRAPNKYKLQDYAGDVVTFIDGIIKKPTIIFGHSLGGHVGILTAAFYPEWVKGLIIVDAPLSLEHLRTTIAAWAKYIKFWQECSGKKNLDEIKSNLKSKLMMLLDRTVASAVEAFDDNHPWLNYMAETISQLDPAALSAMIDDFDRTYQHYCVEKHFRAIKCPVLIIRGGEQGGLISDEELRYAEKLFKNARTIQIPEVGYELLMQNEEAIAKSVSDFIQQLS